MGVTRGFYQPKTDGNKIFWILWSSVLLRSPIWASELFYNLNFRWLAFTLFIILVGVLTWFRRQMRLTGTTLEITRALRLRQETVDLSASDVTWSIEKKWLTLTVAGKTRRFSLNKKLAAALKGIA
ncbi:hypothetical protein FPFC_020880 [Fructobacillus pseudoficulneus]|uniref:Pore-forming protein n=1 Tax=Fructobacillus pseudoficulneus TaxID=220714 RepID=A0A3F3H3H4_9LACO|nr:EbsA family protein [Fructobacillus pseudoficulneus]GAP02640.1 hypothetical protein FPFC_020880 [Fructobacillus pseudoficulneus]SEH38740.1 hypothetical protein SAMN05660469_0576 [Fructobacillus pseudoficulneus]